MFLNPRLSKLCKTHVFLTFCEPVMTRMSRTTTGTSVLVAIGEPLGVFPFLLSYKLYLGTILGSRIPISRCACTGLCTSRVGERGVFLHPRRSKAPPASAGSAPAARFCDGKRTQTADDGTSRKPRSCCMRHPAKLLPQ